MIRMIMAAVVVMTHCEVAVAQDASPADAQGWQYIEIVNPMTQARSQRAYILPNGSNGTEGAMFMVERSGSALRIIVRGDGNFISCRIGGGVETCYVRVRFDDDPAIHSYIGGISRDRTSVIISDPLYVNPFLRRVRSAQSMVMQLEYRYQDDGYYTFAVSGLTF